MTRRAGVVDALCRLLSNLGSKVHTVKSSPQVKVHAPDTGAAALGSAEDVHVDVDALLANQAREGTFVAERGPTLRMAMTPRRVSCRPPPPQTPLSWGQIV